MATTAFSISLLEKAQEVTSNLLEQIVWRFEAEHPLQKTMRRISIVGHGVVRFNYYKGEASHPCRLAKPHILPIELAEAHGADENVEGVTVKGESLKVCDRELVNITSRFCFLKSPCKNTLASHIYRPLEKIVTIVPGVNPQRQLFPSRKCFHERSNELYFRS